MNSKLLWYVAGFLTPVVLFIIAGLLGIIPLPDAQLLISKWGITEDPKGNLLLLTIKDVNNTIAVGIERDPETDYVKEIGITQQPEENQVWNFLYRVKGPSGFPACYYGSPRGGIVWRDLNADCFFDQRINYVKKEMEINIDEMWIKGHSKELAEAEKRVITQDEEIVFDGKIGKWKETNEPSKPK